MVPLGKRRTTRIEPTIHHKGFPLHWLARVGEKRKTVNDGAVQIHIGGAIGVFYARSHRFGHFVLKFLNGTNAFHLAALAAPNRQRRAPISFTRNRPIFDVAQPLSKPALTDPIGRPLHFFVKPQEVLFDSGHADKP